MRNNHMKKISQIFFDIVEHTLTDRTCKKEIESNIGHKWKLTIMRSRGSIQLSTFVLTEIGFATTNLKNCGRYF